MLLGAVLLLAAERCKQFVRCYRCALEASNESVPFDLASSVEKILWMRFESLNESSERCLRSLRSVENTACRFKVDIFHVSIKNFREPHSEQRT
jgi:hypothetical protein